MTRRSRESRRLSEDTEQSGVPQRPFTGGPMREDDNGVSRPLGAAWMPPSSLVVWKPPRNRLPELLGLSRICRLPERLEACRLIRREAGLITPAELARPTTGWLSEITARLSWSTKGWRTQTCR